MVWSDIADYLVILEIHTPGIPVFLAWLFISTHNQFSAFATGLTIISTAIARTYFKTNTLLTFADGMTILFIDYTDARPDLPADQF